MLAIVDAPIVGATKLSHIDGMAGACKIHLTAEDVAYLEEPYRPHDLEGVMADNKPSVSAEPVWGTATRNTK